VNARAFRILVTAVLCAAGLACNDHDTVVSGSPMTLDVTVGGQSIGTFQLTQGTAPSFDVCNF